MKLVKIFKTIVLGLFIALAVPLSSKAVDIVAVNNATTARDTTNDAQVYSNLVTRLSEIQSMDKNNLTTGEKKNLRKELREMKKAADGLNSGVYLSVGAIIIVILLLILLLK